MRSPSIISIITILYIYAAAFAFTPHSVVMTPASVKCIQQSYNNLRMSEKNDDVIELVDDEEDTATKQKISPAPFLSQGEISEEALQMSNDPKQTRVIIYIIISLIPVLFLIPLMLGSRDLIPLDALPPVEI
jgi:hypothetical protein